MPPYYGPVWDWTLNSRLLITNASNATVLICSATAQVSHYFEFVRRLISAEHSLILWKIGWHNPIQCDHGSSPTQLLFSDVLPVSGVFRETFPYPCSENVFKRNAQLVLQETFRYYFVSWFRDRCWIETIRHPSNRVGWRLSLVDTITHPVVCVVVCRRNITFKMLDWCNWYKVNLITSQ